jgi:hypothetical protein
MWQFLSNLCLPKGSDLALWWLGVICVAALALKIDGAKEIALALGGGMVGYLTGKSVTENGSEPVKAPDAPTVT